MYSKSLRFGVLIYVRTVYQDSLLLLSYFQVPYIVLDICPGGSDRHLSDSAVLHRATDGEVLEEIGNLISSLVNSELVILGVLNLDWLSKNSARL